MNAPDKIYVPSRFNLADGLRVRESDSDVEYIRKDALLGWIDEYKNYSSGPSWELLKTHIETL